jgi:uncharacterized protein (TIGR03435 family)
MLCFSTSSRCQLSEQITLNTGRVPSPKALIVEHLLQAKGQTSGDLLPRLKGKPAVLEFWATWCSPCIAAMPRLTKLAEQYKDQVQFVSITQEGPAVVEPFIERRKPAGWVALDTDSSVLRELGVVDFPTTVLMRPDGSTVAVDLDQLNETMLNALISGKPISPKPTAKKSTPTAVSSSVKGADGKPIDGGLPDYKTIWSFPLNKLDLTPSTIEGMNRINIMGPTLIADAQLSARAIIALAYGVPKEYVDGPANILDKPWRIILRVETPEALNQILLAKVDSAFGVRTQIALHNKPVLLLKQSTLGLGKDLVQVDSSSAPEEMRSYSPGAELGTNVTLTNLAESLTDNLGLRVVNETGLNGRWNWTLTWDVTSLDVKADLRRSVEQQLGLKLESAVQKRNVVIVEPK